MWKICSFRSRLPKKEPTKPVDDGCYNSACFLKKLFNLALRNYYARKKFEQFTTKQATIKAYKNTPVSCFTSGCILLTFWTTKSQIISNQYHSKHFLNLNLIKNNIFQENIIIIRILNLIYDKIYLHQLLSLYFLLVPNLTMFIFLSCSIINSLIIQTWQKYMIRLFIHSSIHYIHEHISPIQIIFICI